MYKLYSKSNNEELGHFESVSDAVHRAINIGLPGEEFDIYNKLGERVGGVVASKKPIKHFLSNYLPVGDQLS